MKRDEFKKLTDELSSAREAYKNLSDKLFTRYANDQVVSGATEVLTPDDIAELKRLNEVEDELEAKLLAAIRSPLED